ncbi:hypothetical protein [Lactiplantibacillus herbarum]|uniref:hypothetical protein n=1 Tax=Lactiplantibacillus herbarum TaxID=1670446 RepID=UPI00064EF256|nr:hypothetical protein [Lactiplantibacillus herbarum]
MQRNVQTFIDDITAVKMTQETLSGKYEQLSTQVKPWLTKLVTAVQNDQLAQITLVTVHEPVISFRLETSVINLPWANLTEIGKVTVADDTMPINVYMIAESEALPSGLRIDELGSVDDIVADQANAEQLLTDWLTAQLERLDQITEAEA